MKTKGLILLATLAILSLLNSCADGKFNLQPTPEGCLFSTFQAEDGSTFRAGSCIDPITGKFSTYEIHWKNAAGVQAKTVRKIGSGQTSIYYLQDGTWIEYDSKSGLSIGVVPTVPLTP